MATQNLTVGTTAKDVVSDLSLSAGNYTLQNVGQSLVLVHEGASAPAAAVDYHVVKALDSLGLNVEATSIWVKTKFGSGWIVVTSA